MIKKVLESLTDKQRNGVAALKAAYQNADKEQKKYCSERICGYVDGLTDAEVITMRGRQSLYIYMTL